MDNEKFDLTKEEIAETEKDLEYWGVMSEALYNYTKLNGEIITVEKLMDIVTTGLVAEIRNAVSDEYIAELDVNNFTNVATDMIEETLRKLTPFMELLKPADMPHDKVPGNNAFFVLSAYLSIIACIYNGINVNSK